jgi:hypothetical protein
MSEMECRMGKETCDGMRRNHEAVAEKELSRRENLGFGENRRSIDNLQKTIWKEDRERWLQGRFQKYRGNERQKYRGNERENKSEK